VITVLLVVATGVLDFTGVLEVPVLTGAVPEVVLTTLLGLLLLPALTGMDEVGVLEVSCTLEEVAAAGVVAVLVILVEVLEAEPQSKDMV
jgi:hypothetical protein